MVKKLRCLLRGHVWAYRLEFQIGPNTPYGERSWRECKRCGLLVEADGPISVRAIGQRRIESAEERA